MVDDSLPMNLHSGRAHRGAQEKSSQQCGGQSGPAPPPSAPAPPLRFLPDRPLEREAPVAARRTPAPDGRRHVEHQQVHHHRVLRGWDQLDKVRRQLLHCCRRLPLDRRGRVRAEAEGQHIQQGAQANQRLVVHLVFMARLGAADCGLGLLPFTLVLHPVWQTFFGRLRHVAAAPALLGPHRVRSEVLGEHVLAVDLGEVEPVVRRHVPRRVKKSLEAGAMLAGACRCL